MVQELICTKVRYSLGTCHPSQMRGPVEGRLITMAADGGKGRAGGGFGVWMSDGRTDDECMVE